MPSRQLPEKFLVAFSLAGEQRDLVRAIAEAVEKELGPGTVFLDEWFEYYIAGADADIKLQGIYGKMCELAVVCVSANYIDKPWTQAEYEAIRARQMKCRASTNKLDRERILPIRIGAGDVEDIPFNTIVPDVRHRTAGETAELIIERLRLFVPGFEEGNADPPIDPCWSVSPLNFDWPMADHSSIRKAFATLLTRSPSWRFLPVQGSSGTGKSHISRQMLAIALQVPNLACGRFDFKGSTSMDAEVRVFVQELGVSIPPASSIFNERMGHILDSLVKRKQPALLIFDTYEAAGKPQEDWVERELLTRLVRAPWLRVVIAGQRVPKSFGTVWDSVAHTVEKTKIPPPVDWFDYGKQYRPELKLEEVETAYRLANERASLLAQLLGPDT